MLMAAGIKKMEKHPSGKENILLDVLFRYMANPKRTKTVIPKSQVKAAKQYQPS